MPDETFGNRGMWRGEPAWHGLGTTIPQDDKLTVVEAFKLAKVDYTFHMGQSYGLDPDGNFVEAVGRKQIMRSPVPDDPRWLIIAEASKDFEIIQHMELAEMMEGLNEVYPIETVGALYNGEFLFCSFGLGRFAVGGVDEMELYAMLADRKDGRHKLTVAEVTYRPVCANTVRMALSSAVARIDIRHYTGMKDMLAFKIKALEKVAQINDYTQGLFQRMGEVKITADDFKAAIEATYPLPEKLEEPALAQPTLVEQFERACTKQNGNRLACEALYQLFCQQTPELASTPWAGWNAVTENENHFCDNDAKSVMFGRGSDVQKDALVAFMKYI